MRSVFSAAVPLLLAAAVHAEDVQSTMMTRPLTLPLGAVDLTLHGTYTNWDAGTLGLSGESLDGETLVASADFGVTDRVQFGVAVALPVNPGGFGSVLGSVAIAAVPQAALRVDAGYEQVSLSDGFTSRHTDRFFVGLGASIRVPFTNTFAFVTRRTGAIEFGHFTNIGRTSPIFPPPAGGNVGLYAGASGLAETSADFLVLSAGNNNSSTNIGVNLPAGLLLQPDPHFAITLQVGYSVQIETGSASESDHFLPIGLEAVVSPVQALDIGARFFVDGFFARTGGSACPGPTACSSAQPGYFDMRALQFWLRFHL